MPYLEELLHELGVGVQLGPGQAAQVCVVQVEQVVRGAGGSAALAVPHHALPQCPPLAWQQALWKHTCIHVDIQGV